MGALHLHILGSGSRGNAALIEAPDGLILIDCGFSYKQIKERSTSLGLDVGDIQAVFITHEHTDHIKGISVFRKRHEVPIFCTAETQHANSSMQALPIEAIRPGDSVDIAGISVQAFPTSHDAASPLGFRIEGVGDAIGYCTDTGFVTSGAQEALYDVRLLAFESNHDSRMLATGDYPLYLKQRIASDRGHLSNQQAAQILPMLITNRCEQVIAMHLSAENNRAKTCVAALADALDAQATDALGLRATNLQTQLTIECASQNIPRSYF